MTTENEPTIQSLAEGQQQLTSLLTDFIEEQRKVNDEQREFNQQLRMFIQTQRSANGEIERRIKRIEDDLLEVREFNREQREFNQEQRVFNRAQLEFNERIEGRINTMHNDIAEIKGGHARTEIFRRAETVASALNFTYERALSAGELGDMVRENPDSGLSGGDLESFTKADLVIKAKDRGWLTNYLAVEISYTADQRDIDRARRNADLLTRFTGRPAHAVVASVRNDSVVSNLVSIGYANWYQIPLRDLQAA
jgi:hypothetical protein